MVESEAFIVGNCGHSHQHCEIQCLLLELLYTAQLESIFYFTFLLVYTNVSTKIHVLYIVTCHVDYYCDR